MEMGNISNLFSSILGEHSEKNILK